MFDLGEPYEISKFRMNHVLNMPNCPKECELLALIEKTPDEEAAAAAAAAEEDAAPEEEAETAAPEEEAAGEEGEGVGAVERKIERGDGFQKVP